MLEKQDLKEIKKIVDLSVGISVKKSSRHFCEKSSWFGIQKTG